MKQISGHFSSNAQPILQVLQKVLPENAEVLEIASGPGQHAAFFAESMPNTTWQASEIDGAQLPSLHAYAKDTANMKSPVQIDACSQWPIEKIDAIVCINLLQVSSFQTCCCVLGNAGRILLNGGQLFFYGPFFRPDIETAPGNLMFHSRLQQRDPQWGVPDLEIIEKEAVKYDLILDNVHDLPSNNVVVIFTKSV